MRVRVDVSCGLGSAGRADHECFAQMVPTAASAHLDHVAGSTPLPGGELEALTQLERPAVVASEAIREDVGEKAELVAATDRAGPRGLGPQVPGRPEQLGVGVADLEPRQEAAAEVAQERSLGQRVVDDAKLVAPPR